MDSFYLRCLVEGASQAGLLPSKNITVNMFRNVSLAGSKFPQVVSQDQHHTGFIKLFYSPHLRLLNMTSCFLHDLPSASLSTFHSCHSSCSLWCSFFLNWSSENVFPFVWLTLLTGKTKCSPQDRRFVEPCQRDALLECRIM